MPRESRLPRGLAAKPIRREAIEIGPPPLLVLDAELIEIGPGINPGIVKIIEGDAHCVVADRLQLIIPTWARPATSVFCPGPCP